MRKHLPTAGNFLGKSLPHFPSFIIRDHIGSGNNGHVFRAHAESTGHELACKVVPAANLPRNDEDQELWLQEAKKSNQLQHPAVVRCVDVDLWTGPEVDGPCAVFLYDYVRGTSLRQYLKELQKNTITVGFVEEFLRTMLGLLHELRGRGVEHGDLHAGNVIVAEPSDLDIEPRTSFRVIDFGVLGMTGLGAGHGDALGVGQILRELLSRVDYQASRPRDRYVFDVLRREFLDRYLIETDPLADGGLSSPKAMYERLQGID